MSNFNFEEIKRSATGVADRAAKKTSEVTNIVKLKIAVKTAESKLSSVYEEIGRLFYTAERSGEDCTSDIAAYIMKADKLKADIASYNGKIARMRNVRTCENCGASISMSSNFCSVCGAKQETLEEVEEEEAIEECGECLEEEAEEIKEKVVDAFDKAKDKAEEFFSGLTDEVSDAAEEMTVEVEEIKDEAAEAIENAVDGIENKE